MRGLGAVALFTLLEIAAGLPVDLAASNGARAQGFFFGGPPQQQQRRPRSGFFDFFGQPVVPQGEERPQPQIDYSRAPPPPRKGEGTPTMSVMVLGDSMADWLAYGLEDALSDSPEISVVRKPKAHSGLIRYDAKSDLDWWHVARDELAKEKVDFVVMMLGINDRQAIRETAVEKKTGKPDPKADGKTDPKTDVKTEAEKNDPAESEIIAPEPQRGRRPGVNEFRTEKWEEIYSKRIDETIAALKGKGVPVLWVGLPSLRGTRSTADVVYLNDLYRARAEKAGIVYVDVWDGFVDESGKFNTHGPDFEGQIRRLRTGDGVHFTKAGARKLAHYVERELRRFMSNRATPVALPGPGAAPAGAPSEPSVRPVAGPVVPLTTETNSNDELLGGNNVRPVHADPTATRVLVKGEPVPAAPGRADDFSWPRASDPNLAEPLSPTAAAARADPAPAPGAKPAAKKAAKQPEPPKPARTGSRPPRTDGAPRPNANIGPDRRAQQQPPPQRDRNPFGFFR